MTRMQDSRGLPGWDLNTQDASGMLSRTQLFCVATQSCVVMQGLVNHCVATQTTALVKRSRRAVQTDPQRCFQMFSPFPKNRCVFCFLVFVFLGMRIKKQRTSASNWNPTLFFGQQLQATKQRTSVFPHYGPATQTTVVMHLFTWHVFCGQDRPEHKRHLRFESQGWHDPLHLTLDLKSLNSIFPTISTSTISPAASMAELKFFLIKPNLSSTAHLVRSLHWRLLFLYFLRISVLRPGCSLAFIPRGSSVIVSSMMSALFFFVFGEVSWFKWPNLFLVGEARALVITKRWVLFKMNSKLSSMEELESFYIVWSTRKSTWHMKTKCHFSVTAFWVVKWLGIT